MEWIKASSLKDIKFKQVYFAKLFDGSNSAVKSTGWFQESDGTFFWDNQGYVPILKKDWDHLFVLDESTPAIPEDVEVLAEREAEKYVIDLYKEYTGKGTPEGDNVVVQKRRDSHQDFSSGFLAGAAHIQKQGEATVKKAQADLIWAMIQENQDADDGPFTKADIEADLYDWFKKLEIKNPVAIPSSIVRRLEEIRDKIFELAEKETDDFQRTVYFSHGSDINIASQLITKYASILLSPQPEIKLEEDINVAMAEGAEFVVTRMVGDDPQPAEQGEENFYLYDEITNQLEGIASVEDAKTFIRENYIEGNSIHPDFSAFLILKEVGTVETIEENDEVKGIQIKLSNHNQQS